MTPSRAPVESSRCSNHSASSLMTTRRLGSPHINVRIDLSKSILTKLWYMFWIHIIGPQQVITSTTPRGESWTSLSQGAPAQRIRRVGISSLVDEYLTVHTYQGNLWDAICDVLEFADTWEDAVGELAARDISESLVHFLWRLAHI